MRRENFLAVGVLLVFFAVYSGPGGIGLSHGAGCMAACKKDNAGFFDSKKALTQFCKDECGLGRGTGSCSAEEDGCCVPQAGDPDCMVVARYDGPSDGPYTDNDEAWAIAIGTTGNIYVTGESQGTDNTENITTIAYDSDLNELWVKRYDGSSEPARSIATDASGNVYVTGSTGNGPVVDLVTIAYDASGTELWARVYDGPAGGYDEARAIATDSAGNVFVTGWSMGAGTGTDIVTIAYDSGGNELWLQRYDGPDNMDDDGRAITTDSAGNVYVTGMSYYDVSGQNNIVTIAYDASGNELWARIYDNPEHGSDECRAIAITPSGTIYVTGLSFLSGYSDIVTIAYDASGTELWVQNYDGPAGKNDYAMAIATNSSGMVYVTGVSKNNGTEEEDDIITVAYDAGGTELWVQRYDGPAGKDDAGLGVATDPSGKVYVTGESTGTDTEVESVTIAYEAGGSELWVRRYDGPDGLADHSVAIAVGPSGNVYVTGFSFSDATKWDYLTIKY